MYEKFLEEVGNFVLWRISRNRRILFLFRETVTLIWQKKRQSFIDWGWRRWFFQVEDTVFAGKFSGVTGEAEKYNGAYQTEWEFLKDVLMKTACRRMPF